MSASDSVSANGSGGGVTLAATGTGTGNRDVPSHCQWLGMLRVTGMLRLALPVRLSTRADLDDSDALGGG